MELPDEAFDRRKELTSGEYELYQVLCKYRCRDKHHENYGLSFPGRGLVCRELAMVKGYVSTLMSGLIRKKWLEKDGWKARLLVGNHVITH